jgi:hypothetical protein
VKHLLIPHEVSDSTATLWLGVIGGGADSARLQLRSNVGRHELDEDWQHWQAAGDGGRIDYQRITLNGLDSRAPYAFSLVHEDGRLLADAKLTTLPKRIPSATEKPFTVLLGSCFCRGEDQQGRVGLTYARMPPAARPDLKLLTGDQVYLDSPWHHFLISHSCEELEARFLGNYTKTWSQTDGFHRLLKDGANYFCSDDHELWNNAPNRAAFIKDTWPLFDKRECWLRAACSLYQVFQTPFLTTSFAVAPVSFFIADTRMQRKDDRSSFMPTAALDALRDWIEGLRGPGVLVLGQPILRARTGFWGRFSDWSLPDFDQYETLVRELVRSRHSLVIVTGDVHYGRIARCDLLSGGELIEIITSPLSLVDKKAEGSWEAAPDNLPPFEMSGLPKTRVSTEAFETNRAHFLTLEFRTHGAGVVLDVRFWPILNDQATPDGHFGATIWQWHLR